MKPLLSFFPAISFAGRSEGAHIQHWNAAFQAESQAFWSGKQEILHLYRNLQSAVSTDLKEHEWVVNLEAGRQSDNIRLLHQQPARLCSDLLLVKLISHHGLEADLEES